jgi:hypothetical protein
MHGLDSNFQRFSEWLQRDFSPFSVVKKSGEELSTVKGFNEHHLASLWDTCVNTAGITESR